MVGGGGEGEGGGGEGGGGEGEGGGGEGGSGGGSGPARQTHSTAALHTPKGIPPDIILLYCHIIDPSLCGNLLQAEGLEGELANTTR